MLKVYDNDNCFNCEKCDQIVKSESELQNHLRNHHLEYELKNFQLEVISLKDRVQELTHRLGEMETSTTASKSSHSHHLVENEELSLKCEKCQFETKYISLLDEHMKEKHIIYMFEYCEFTSSSDKGLKIHKTKSHSQLTHPIVSKSGDTVCDLCGHNFNSKSDMQDHMKESHFIELNNRNVQYKNMDTNVQYIECTICGKIKFTYKNHANHLIEEYLLLQI